MPLKSVERFRNTSKGFGLSSWMPDPIWAQSLPAAVSAAEKQKEGTTEDSNYSAWLQCPAIGQPGYETPSIWPLLCWRIKYFCNPYLELLRTGKIMPSHFKSRGTHNVKTQKNSQLPPYNSNSTSKIHLPRSCASLVSLKSVMTDNIRSQETLYQNQ